MDDPLAFSTMPLNPLSEPLPPLPKPVEPSPEVVDLIQLPKVRKYVRKLIRRQRRYKHDKAERLELAARLAKRNKNQLTRHH